MTINTTKHNSPSHRFPLSLFWLWTTLYHPTTFVLALSLLSAILIAVSIIPQQPTQLSTPIEVGVWVSELPPIYQKIYPLFNTFGLTRIYKTAWFWLPLAIITLVSLITLANYILPALHRVKKPIQYLNQFFPYPFSYIEQKKIRLPAPQQANEATATDPSLAELQTQLQQVGYQTISTQTDKPILAIHHAWHWGSPIVITVGILILILGVSIQFIWGKMETVFITVPSKITDTTFIGQSIDIKKIIPFTNKNGYILGATVETMVEDTHPINWQLYRPYRLNGWWVIATKFQPELEISFTPTQNTHFVFEDTAYPILFSYTSPDSHLEMDFEIRYLYTPTGDDYQLQLVSENLPGSVEIIQQDKKFTLTTLDIEGQVLITPGIRLYAYKLPGLFAFVIGTLIFLVGNVQIALATPTIVLLNAFSKGRGSNIEVTVETIGERVGKTATNIDDYKTKIIKMLESVLKNVEEKENV